MEENKPIQNEDEKSLSATNNSPQQDPQLNNLSSDKTIANTAEASGIVDPTPDLKNMEVHHHSHESYGKKTGNLISGNF